MTRHSIKSSSSSRFGTGSSVAGGTSNWLWGWLLPEPERSSACHAWSDHRRCGRSDGNGPGAFVSRDISEGFRQGLFAKRTTWAGRFLLHRYTSAEGSRLGGARNDVWFDVRGRKRPSSERRSRSFGSANGGWVCSRRLRVPYLRGRRFLERS